MKRILYAAITVLAVMLGVFAISSNQARAYTSAKQVKKEIRAVDKKIAQENRASSKAQAKYKSLAAKDKAETAGSHLLLLAKIENTNPFIVSIGGRYYRVFNPSNGTTLLGHYTASVRSSGGTTYYSGVSCTNVTAVKSSVDAKLTQARREMNRHESLRKKLVKKRNKLKKTLTYRVPSKKIVMEDDDTRSLSAISKNKSFNKVTWKVANTGVARIKKGKLCAVKSGSTVLSARTSISRKTTKIPITVKGLRTLQAPLAKSELRLSAGEIVGIGFKEYDEDAAEEYAVASGVSSDSSVATVSIDERSEATIQAHGEGVATITLTSVTESNVRYVGTCTVTVINPLIEMSEEKIVLETKEFPYAYTVSFRSNIAKNELKYSARINREQNSESYNSWDDETSTPQVILNYEKAITGGDMQAGTATIYFSASGEYEFLLYSDYRYSNQSTKKAEIVVRDTNVYKSGKPIESISIQKGYYASFSIAKEPEDIQEVFLDDPEIASAHTSYYNNNTWTMEGDSPGRTTAHIRTRSGCQIDIPVVVYDVELTCLDSYGNEMDYDVSETLSESYYIREDEDNRYYWKIKYSPQETEEPQITVTSSDEDVVEIGEWEEDKLYFTLKGKGTVDVTITTPFWSGTMRLYVSEY